MIHMPLSFTLRRDISRRLSYYAEPDAPLPMSFTAAIIFDELRHLMPPRRAPMPRFIYYYYADAMPMRRCRRAMPARYLRYTAPLWQARSLRHVHAMHATASPRAAYIRVYAAPDVPARSTYAAGAMPPVMRAIAALLRSHAYVTHMRMLRRCRHTPALRCAALITPLR